MVSYSKFEVISPTILNDALQALATDSNVRPLAGATDIMVQLEMGSLSPCTFMNLEELAELHPPSNWSPDGPFVLPALTTYRQARVSSLCTMYPLLATAAREVGSLAIQSRGTWVGNVANASPAADGVPALMVYDAELELRSRNGSRRVELARFYRGYKEMDMRTDEMITAIHLAAPRPGFFEYYRKVGSRRFQTISKTLLAGRIRLDSDTRIDEVRLVFASVAPFTLRAIQTERVVQGRHLTSELIDEAATAIQDEIRPINDIRSTETYRRRVTSNLVREFLSQSMKRLSGHV